MPTDILPADEITAQNIRKDPETGSYQFDDEAALKLMLDDTKTADNWMNINSQWAAGWTQSDMLYQSPQTAFDGLAGISVPKFTLSNHLSAIIPKIMGGLFYDDPPFLLRPRPGTDPNVVRAKTALIAYQLDDMHFKKEIEMGLEQMGLLGTGIWKWGWLTEKRRVKKYKRKGTAVVVETPLVTARVETPDSNEFEIEYEEKEVFRPWLKYCDIRTVLVDPGCREGDISKAKWVIFRDYATWRDLEDLREADGYNIPDEDVLKQFFLERSTPHPDNMAMTLPEGMRGYLQHALPRNYKTTADPLENGLEILERVDEEKAICVLRYADQNILIRNQPNEYAKVNYLSANWRNIPDCFYGQGLGQLIGSEQMVEQGTIALALGMLAYGLQPTAVRKKGFNAISQPTTWEQGGIIDVEEDVDKAFKFLEFPKVPPEAWQMVGLSQATSQETSGANQQTTLGAGAQGVKTTGMRSGTGAALVGQANASRLDGPVERFIDQVMIPWIYQMDELNNDKLPTRILNAVLSEEIGQQFTIDHMKFREAKIEYEVLAGAHLGAKKEMAQFMAFVQQTVNNPTLMEMAAEQNLGFDFKAWFDQFADLAAIKFRQPFFVPMTPEQKQRRMANSPAGVAQAKVQGAQQSEIQKFQQEQKLLDQEQIGKGANEVQRILLEHTLNQEEGANVGFGTDTEG